LEFDQTGLVSIQSVQQSFKSNFSRLLSPAFSGFVPFAIQTPTGDSFLLLKLRPAHLPCLGIQPNLCHAGTQSRCLERTFFGVRSSSNIITILFAAADIKFFLDGRVVNIDAAFGSRTV